MGCGTGETFTPSDADINRWAILIVAEGVDIERVIQEIDSSRLINKWRNKSTSEYRAILENISSHGQWSRREPFQQNAARGTAEGKIAAITRARLRPTKALTFWKSIPPVVVALKNSKGLLHSFGIGEAPLGLQGTFSIWQNAASIKAFAYESAEHRRAIENTSRLQWYSEELFARFTVLDERGEIRARSTS